MSADPIAKSAVKRLSASGAVSRDTREQVAAGPDTPGVKIVDHR